MKVKIFGRYDFRFELILLTYFTAGIALLCVGFYLLSVMHFQRDEAIATLVSGAVVFGIFAILYLWRILPLSEELLDYKKRGRTEKIVEIGRGLSWNLSKLAFRFWIAGGFIVSVFLILFMNFTLYRAFLVFFGALLGGEIGSLLMYYLSKLLISTHFSEDLGKFYRTYTGEVRFEKSLKLTRKTIETIVMLVGFIVISIVVLTYQFAVDSLLTNIKSMGMAKLSFLVKENYDPEIFKSEGWKVFEVKDGVVNGIERKYENVIKRLKKVEEGSGYYIDYERGNVYLWVFQKGVLRGIIYPWERVNRRDLKRIILTALFITILSLLIITGVSLFHIRDLAQVVKEINAGFSGIMRGEEPDKFLKISTVPDDELQESLDGFVFTSIRLSESLKSFERISQEIGDKAGYAEEIYKNVLEESQKGIESLKGSEEKLNSVLKGLENLKTNLFLSSKSVDEISSSAVEMDANLKSIFDIIGDFTERVSASIKTISHIHEKMEESFNLLVEVGKTVEEELNVISKMEELTTEIQNRIKGSQEKTFQVVELARAGTESVIETIEIIKEMKEFINNLASLIDKLVSRSREVGNILSLIDDLADETNLLSLNASIIAAQAGEHGRAFAVVADQVRELAERTSISTRDVRRILEDIAGGTSSLKEAVEKGRTNIEKGVERVFRMDTDFRNITKSASESAEISTELTRFSEEQMKKIKETFNKFRNFIKSITHARDLTRKIVESMRKVSESNNYMQTMIEKIINASVEQEKGGRIISQNIENISDIFKFLDKSMGEEMKRIGELKPLILEGIERFSRLLNIMEEVHEKLKELERDSVSLSQSFKFIDRG